VPGVLRAHQLSFALAVLWLTPAGVQSSFAQRLTLELTTWAEAPITGEVDGASNRASLARINVLREEPGGRGRFFLADLNGPLYVVDAATKTFTTYLDFNGAEGKPGLFKRFTFRGGFATGLIGFQFDPRYATNGRFYTIHMEDPVVGGPLVPDPAAAPGLKVDGYTPTPAIRTPGPVQKEVVLVEWTDSMPANTAFEGSAREILRIEVNTHIHPMGDLTFNPAAREGDPDWGVMYIGSGDGSSGEQTNLVMRHNPQRLDTLVGKILRIIPDPTMHAGSSTVSENGRYRVPNDNPFVSIAGARPEIWAVGIRNPHRLTWTADPASPTRPRLVANNIGFRTWETILFIERGANYGYSAREGNQAMALDNSMGPLPTPDEIPVRVSDTTTRGTVTPVYPVAQYPHLPAGGDAIAGGFLYRGTALPALRGKYLFGDISTGRIWYLDYDDMLAAHDSRPETMAERKPVHVTPAGRRPAAGDARPAAGAGSAADPGAPLSPIWAIVEAAYHARGGKDPDLPGRSTVSGGGRVDMRFAEDEAGELYIFSKSDGIIRSVTGARLD
jgi:hypothetical protein